ncbi:MAG: hypothetical protein ACHQF0_07990 [Chitinophagales bacterium]
MAFDVTEWINSKLGSALDEKAIKSIKDFSLVWNIFEDRACDNNPTLAILGKFVDSIATSLDSAEKITTNTFEYFKKKYVDKDKINLRFTFLNLRKSDNPAFVESTLLAENPSLRDRALALLIIISQYRNNLYHALTDMTQIHEQKENFRIANRFLATILEISGLI